MSLPMGERGLKLMLSWKKAPMPLVAPYGGAWIETYNPSQHLMIKMVAPYGGAWIETRDGSEKHCSPLVAPYGGAWIETRRWCTCSQ